MQKRYARLLFISIIFTLTFSCAINASAEGPEISQTETLARTKDAEISPENLTDISSIDPTSTESNNTTTDDPHKTPEDENIEAGDGSIEIYGEEPSPLIDTDNTPDTEVGKGSESDIPTQPTTPVESTQSNLPSTPDTGLVSLDSFLNNNIFIPLASVLLISEIYLLSKLYHQF